MKLHHSLHSPQFDDTVVLLHGMGSCADDWLLQVPLLATRYRVVALDARGHGNSPKPPGPYSIPQMADDAVETLDWLGIGAAHVVGLSMGGCTALQLAIAHPSRVRSLVIVNSYARVQPAGWRGALRFLQRAWALTFGSMDEVAEPVAYSMFPKPEQAELRRIAHARIAGNPRGPYRAALMACVTFNALPQLSCVACPTLIVAGDRDLTVALPLKQQLRQGIPGAELRLIPDSGHATPVDQPEPFNRALLEFLSRH
ncbi:MAG: alpha/beta fold hydrolase [Chloroflexi bacterium]|nr:alpha/beta fold hydrolase [Chloroflexota bacterium]